MDGSWRFRSLQSPLCPVCSISHFPFCPPPSSDRLALAAVDRHRRFPPPCQDPAVLDRRPLPPFPPPPHQDPFLDHRPPPSLPPPTHYPHPHSRLSAEDGFLQHDPFHKRMRVEDPGLISTPPPRIFWDDERRLSLIREHGRQDLAPIPDHGFSNGYRGFQDIPRPQSSEIVLPPDRRDFGGGEVDSMRSSWQGSDFYDPRIPAVRHDRPVYLNESSSYSLSKQPQYSHLESYRPLPRIASNEHESPHPPPYTQPESYRSIPRIASNEQDDPYPSLFPSMRPPLENKTDAPFEPKQPYFEEMRKPVEPHGNFAPYERTAYRMDSAVPGLIHTSQMHPPLPPQPPFPPPPEPSPPPSSQVGQSVLAPPSKLSPEPVSAPPTLFPIATSSQGSLEPKPMLQSKFYNEISGHSLTGFVSEGLPLAHQTPSKEYMEGREQSFPVRNSVKDKPTTIDACHLFRQPHRASRPDHIVVILRGLPGSGKSYLAKALRDLEVETGGNAPRIHAMDDYFMIEVEKIEDNESSKSSGSTRGRKQITKKVIEYCYEPEMEEAYRSSMLKAFKKTLDEGNFTFIIVDDRNLRVADFAQFWAIAKRSGYEVYLMEATYKDPTGCAARNVHGFTLEDIQKMAEQWEEAPSLYLQLDSQSLFHGDHLNEQSIQEVEMDTDDGLGEEETDKLQRREDPKITEPKTLENTRATGVAKIGERWHDDDDGDDDDDDEEVIGVKDLGNSKWLKDLDEDTETAGSVRGNLSALSGLIQAYGKGGKSVHWGDQVEKSGFSIGAVKKQNRSSLIIGPGSGYNLSSNPIQADDASSGKGESSVNESKRRFTEQLRAERESFKAVFDKRRQRIGGMWDVEDD